MALTPQQLAEAQNWIQSSGYGSFSPSGGFSLNGGDTAGFGILGAAQSMGYDPTAVSEITRGAFTPGQVSDFWNTNKPQVDTYQTVFEADKSRAMPAGAPAAPMASQFTTPPTLGSGGRNSYLTGIADDITRRSQQALGRSFNMMDSSAIGTGGYGGSRQGVAQGIATANANDALTGNLANLFGTDYNNQQNRDLQKYGIDTNAFLTNRGQDQSFYTSQRGQDLAQIGLGSQLESQALQNQWYPISQFANIVGNLSGQNTSTTNSSQTGGGAMGTLGGLLGTAQLGTNLKWW